MEALKIKEIYEGKVARQYDRSMSHFFARLKEKAMSKSSLKRGDTVVVFCCGTGLDFPPILKRIGKSGKIIGIDFSSEMLRQAQEKIKKHQWENAELIEADVTTFKNKLPIAADIGVCTLGISIIPDYKSAYYNLIANVKESGEIIIGDMQLASGLKSKLNPLTILMARRFGGTQQGHQNSLELQELMKSELHDVRKKEFFFNSYYYCIGKK